MAPRPPRFVEQIVAACLPKLDRDLVQEDLREDYARRRQRSRGALFWYVAQAVHLAVIRPHLPRLSATSRVRSRGLMYSIWQDARYGFRGFRRNPVFTAVAVVSLAVGIGLNSTLFTVVDNLLFRPLPVTSPSTLAAVYTSSETGDRFATTSYPDLQDLAAGNSVFTDMVGHTLMFAAVSMAGQNRLALGEVVTANYFSALGVAPTLGRGFAAGEDKGEGAHPVVVISDRLWKGTFGSRADVLGQTVTIKNRTFQIVGVAPPEFIGMMPGLVCELWLPLSMVESVEPAGMNDVGPSPSGNTRMERRGTRWLFVKGRLRDGVTVEAAEANLAAMMSRLAAAYPVSNKGRRPTVVPAASVRFHPAIDATMRPAGAVMMVAVGLVLLIACANLANMLLARGASRTREMAVRTAIGAGRFRIVRQLIVESLVLALMGGLLGLVLAAWATRLLVNFDPPIDLPLSFALTFDARIFVYTLALSLITGLVFGLLPAWRASRTELIPALRDDANLVTGGRRFALRHALVVVQVAVSIVLIVAGLLMTRSLGAALATRPGFDPRGLVVAGLSLDLHGYDDTRARTFLDRAIERMRQLPGVQSVSFAERVPFSMNVQTTQIVVDGRPDATPSVGATVDTTRVTGEYFATLGVPIIDGRAFDARDTPDAPRAVIVSEALARRYFPGDSAVGKRLRQGDQSGRVLEIVGVAGDYATRSVAEAPRETVHFARSQRFSGSGAFMLRTTGDPASLVSVVERELRAMEPNVVFLELGPLDRMIALSLHPISLGATLLGAMAALAILLAGLGLYGVIAFGVARRTREIGIRMALGSPRSAVVRQVAGEGLTMVGVGGAIGLALAAAGAQALRGVLHGVTPLDPLSYAAAIGLLLATTLTACVVPARRAASVDPIVALRST